MTYNQLPDRLAAVRERIEAAATRGGRALSDVEIVAVTKTHPPEAITAVVEAGIRAVGENRIQELESKVEALGREAAEWHVIGHIQRNKARRALELGDLIHSVDSLRLARKLSTEAEDEARRCPVLIQVNVSGEESKGGFEGDGVLDQIGEVCDLRGLEVRGLMTMAPWTDDQNVVRRVFSAARELQENAARTISGFEPRHLSMGMSSDFEVAVEEGSTMVRLGTVLLGERPR